MSMIGNLRRLGDGDLNRLIADPDLISDYLYEDDVLEGFGAFAEMDVDKAWHGIHFLLTGTAWDGEPPLDFWVQGGTEIGDVDIGYGPARGLRSHEVRALAEALRPLSEAQLRERFVPEQMIQEEIYPSIWDRAPEEDDTLGYLMGYYEDMCAFISGAADRGEALIVYIN